MIITGTLSAVPEPKTITVELTLDTSRYEAALRNASRDLEKFRRRSRTMATLLELLPLNADQAWARFYVRGAMDPSYAAPAQVDEYLRILLGVPGPVAAAAREAFLRGWVTHRAVGRPAPQVWHRYLAGTAVQVVI